MGRGTMIFARRWWLEMVLGALLGVTIIGVPLCFAGDGAAKAQACGACHGPDGNSVNPEWPKLAGQHAQYTFTQLQAFNSGARTNPNMNAMVAPLSDEDMQDIAAYYAAGAPQIGSADVADITLGEALYRGGNKESGVPACMACHSPSGAGNPAANYPALSGQHATYTALQLRAYRDGTRTTDPNAMMRTIAARMSEAEIESVAKFISALH